MRRKKGRRFRYQLYRLFFSTRAWRCIAAPFPRLLLLDLVTGLVTNVDAFYAEKARHLHGSS